jgi:hypothetical protein
MPSTFIRSAGHKFPVLLLDKLTRFLGLCRRIGRSGEGNVESSRKWNGWFPVLERRNRTVECIGRHIDIVMNGLRDCLFCGMPLALVDCMNHQTSNNNQFESTYALLVRSEEKGRGVLEAVLYIAFILSAVVLIWEFAHSSVSIPSIGLEQGAVSQAAKTEMISRG